MLDMMNSSLETLILNSKEALGIFDLRSLGYYKIRQGVLQQNLCHPRSESLAKASH